MLYKIGVLKNLAKFTAKFMWTAASGISENRLYLAPAVNLLVFCKIDCKSVFKVLSLSNEIHFSNDIELNEHPTNVLKLMTQHKW